MREGRALKPPEIQALLAAEDDDTRLIIKTAILTGMRRAELFAVRWEDVDFKADVIRVRQTLYWTHGKAAVSSEKG
jgi:integrase